MRGAFPPTRQQMTLNLAILNHHTAFNNKQKPYHITIYTRPYHEKCKSIV